MFTVHLCIGPEFCCPSFPRLGKDFGVPWLPWCQLGGTPFNHDPRMNKGACHTLFQMEAEVFLLGGWKTGTWAKPQG